MAMKKNKRGRPKGSKKDTGIDNLYFWINVAKDPELSVQFRERGNDRQKQQLNLAEKYLRGVLK